MRYGGPRGRPRRFPGGGVTELQVEEARFDGPLLGQRYQLGPRIGSGGQGGTHLALDTRSQQRVAVKSFELAKVKEWKQLELFRRECQVLKELAHHGIPRFLGELTSDDNAVSYLVMEYIPGQSLAERMKTSGGLSESELWRILWQLTAILDYLHSRRPPVVHRDIKPANIIMRPDGDLALVDFGVVQTDHKPKGGETFVGTLGFMAPEQFHGDATTATDMYSLGATLISLACAVAPEDLPHEGLRIKFDEGKTLSDELRDLLHHLTEPEPARRPQHGAALRETLQAKSRKRPSLDQSNVEPLDTAALPPPVGMAVGVLLALVGTVGTVSLTVLESVLVPFIFMIIALTSPPSRRPQLREREADVRHALKVGSNSFQQLGTGGYHSFQRHQRRLDEQSRLDANHKQLRADSEGRSRPRR